MGAIRSIFQRPTHAIPVETEEIAALQAITSTEDAIPQDPVSKEISLARSCSPQLLLESYTYRRRSHPTIRLDKHVDIPDLWQVLEIICPNNNCNSPKAMKWFCSKDKTRLYISSSGIIACSGSKLKHSGGVIDWTFSCCKTCFTYPGDDENFESIWGRRLNLSYYDSRLQSAISTQKRNGRDRSSGLIAIQDLDDNERIDYSEHLDIHEFNFTKRAPPSLFEDGKISDSAEKTCNTIVVGFEMTVSQNILCEGSAGTKLFGKTKNATRLLTDISSKRKIWFADKKKEMFARISKIEELLTAIANKDHDEIMRIYYRSQHIHTFDGQTKPLQVHVYVHKDRLNIKWLPHIQDAIHKISIAAPGIQFIYQKESLLVVGSTNYIEIGIDDPTLHDSAYTSYIKGYPFIHLGRDWPAEDMIGTSIHELVHALGFSHVMTRFDSDLYLEVNTVGLSDQEAFQYKRNPSYGMLTRFDPFSIMMYPEDERTKRAPGDQIWHLKDGPERSQDLSELDKVALNLMYKPCYSNSEYAYSPMISEITQMFYCGRDVMQSHNQNVPPTLTSICGPTIWANCPSCRVFRDLKDAEDNRIRIDQVQRCLGKGKWQGLSGNFYCGKQFTSGFITFRFDTCIESDGVCGPDQGIPCTDCGNKLKPGYSYKDFNPIPENALK